MLYIYEIIKCKICLCVCNSYMFANNFPKFRQNDLAVYVSMCTRVFNLPSTNI